MNTYLEELAAWLTGSCFTARRAANQMGIRFRTESLVAWYLRGSICWGRWWPEVNDQQGAIKLD